MKKLIFAVLFCVLGSLSYGQTVILNDYADNIGTANKVLTTGADTINIQIPKARTAINFKYNITKNSGTVGGTIVLQARVTPSTNTREQWTQVNSYTITDATANNSVALTANQWVYYRIITTTSGGNSTHNKQLVARGY